MPIDRFEGRLVVKTRDQIRDEYLRDCRLRQPLADVSPGTEPHLDATNFADGLMPAYANIPALGDATTFWTARGALLDQWGEALGRLRKGASGSVGYVTTVTATGGSTVVAGDQLVYSSKNLLFEAFITGPASNGGQVAIRGLTTGPSTNLPPGTKLRWRNPRVGMGPEVTVFENADGSGLTGGAVAEDDSQYQQALLTLSQNPPAMGNEGEVLKAIDDIKGVAIQQGFVWPAIKGAGTKAVTITIRPAAPGGSRVPNNAQLTLLESSLKDRFPGDDGIITVTLVEHEVPVVLQVTWRSTTAGFVDATPWPPYVADPVHVTNAAAIAPTAFRVTSASSTTAPTVGKTVALYDPITRAFVAKRIATVTAAGANTWDLTFSTTVASSDTSFTPSDGAIVSPWSDSLDSVVAPVLAYMDLQGPGEMFSSFDDPGVRKKRFPEAGPDSWPSRVENRMLDPIFSVVSDAVIAQPAVPHATTIGTPPALAYLHRLTDLAIYPQT